jgi:hypothetical protein
MRKSTHEYQIISKESVILSLSKDQLPKSEHFTLRMQTYRELILRQAQDGRLGIREMGWLATLRVNFRRGARDGYHGGRHRRPAVDDCRLN